MPLQARPSDQRFHFGQHIICTSTALSAGRLAVHPFSILKTYAQVGAPGGKMGPSRTFQFMVRHEGVKGMLSRGLVISAVKPVVHYGILFGAYDRFSRRLIPKSNNPNDLITIEQIAGAYFSGLFAGTLATLISHPMDMVKTRLISQPLGIANHYYGGASDGFHKVMTQEGIYRGIYRGLFPSLIGGSSFGANLFLTLYITDNIPYRKQGVRLLGPFDDLFWATVAFGGAAFINHPIDVIRKKVMAQSAVLAKGGSVDFQFKNMLELVIQMWRYNGLWSFYQGLLPNMMKVGPQMMVFAIVYNSMKNGWLALGGSAKLAT